MDEPANEEGLDFDPAESGAGTRPENSPRTKRELPRFAKIQSQGYNVDRFGYSRTRRNLRLVKRSPVPDDPTLIPQSDELRVTLKFYISSSDGQVDVNLTESFPLNFKEGDGLVKKVSVNRAYHFLPVMLQKYFFLID